MKFFAKIFIALIIAAGFYYAVDYLAVKNWNNNESLIVRIIEAGPESVVKVKNKNDDDDDNDDNDKYETLERDIKLQVLSGNNREIMTIKTVRLAGNGPDIIPGRCYLLVWDMFDDGKTQYSIADAFRVSHVAGVVMCIVILLVAFTGTRGLLALLGLGASIAVLIFTMIPLITQGWPPVMLAVACIFIISVVTIMCVIRHVRYMLIALMGSLGGVLCGFLSGALMVYIWQLSGLAGEGAALLASTIPEINMRGLLLASVLVGSIGAVLDVCVSVTASMSEIAEYDENIPLDRLLLAGLNVGSEVLGSMINTLILAYMGSSLPMAVLICSAGAELTGILNDPYIAQEIVQGLAGTLGLLFTIPATAFSFVFQESLRRRND